MFVSADVTSEQNVKTMVDKVINRFGTIDIVVNNAGLVLPGSVIEMTLEQWNKVFQMNVTSTYLVSHHAIPLLLKQMRGSIINISSEAGLKGLKIARHIALQRPQLWV